MSGQYILDENNNPVPVDDLLEWARWFETADRTVAKTDVGDVVVHTVFLGLDFALDEQAPEIFETKMFGKHRVVARKFSDLLNDYCERCSTHAQALVQHQIAVEEAGKILEEWEEEHVE